jgi:hypothetical protein
VNIYRSWDKIILDPRSLLNPKYVSNVTPGPLVSLPGGLVVGGVAQPMVGGQYPGLLLGGRQETRGSGGPWGVWLAPPAQVCVDVAV